MAITKELKEVHMLSTQVNGDARAPTASVDEVVTHHQQTAEGTGGR